MIRVATSVSLVLAGVLCGYLAGRSSLEHAILAPREAVTVVEAGLPFLARLDTGAVVSSINAEDIRVIDGEGRPTRRDVGRMVRFTVVNDGGERRELTARIEQVRGIRSADCREVRYHVYLTIAFRGRSHRVLTNLNDRSGAGEKLLLGRNWLHLGYAVAPLREREI